MATKAANERPEFIDKNGKPRDDSSIRSNGRVDSRVDCGRQTKASNPLKRLFASHTKTPTKSAASATDTATNPAPSLPFVAIVKPLGAAPAEGLVGIACVKRPTEQLIREAESCSLPARRLRVQIHGVDIAATTASSATLPSSVTSHTEELRNSAGSSSVFHRIESLSYVAASSTEPRVFSLVAIDLAAGGVARKPTCHAFLCESSDTCRQVVAAIAYAFQEAFHRRGREGLFFRLKGLDSGEEEA